MTVFGLLIDGLLLVVMAGMFFFGKFGVTRQMALAPGFVAVLDGAFALKIDPRLTVVLSSVLIILQLTVLLGSTMLLYQDRVRAKNRATRRRRQRQLSASRAAFEAAGERAVSRRRASEICA